MTSENKLVCSLSVVSAVITMSSANQRSVSYSTLLAVQSMSLMTTSRLAVKSFGEIEFPCLIPLSFGTLIVSESRAKCAAHPDLASLSDGIKSRLGIS